MIEGFFNDEWADNIQMISIWLEALGLGLVIIEIFKNEWARRIEAFIDNTEERTSVWFAKIGSFLPYSVETEKRSGIVSGPFLRWLLTICFLGYTFMYIERMVNGEVLGQLDTVVFFFMGIVSIITLAYYLLKGLNAFIRFLNKLSAGKALGSIGLLLAILGFTGEVYQVLTML